MSIVRVLESEFRLSAVHRLHHILMDFLRGTNNTNIQQQQWCESFALQLYFDLSVARAVFEKEGIDVVGHGDVAVVDMKNRRKQHTKNGNIIITPPSFTGTTTAATTAVSDLWDEMLQEISGNHIDFVTMSYLESHLQREIAQSVDGCLLMYGIHERERDRLHQKNFVSSKQSSNDNHQNIYGGGNIFACPLKIMPRIRTLPVASYDVMEAVNDPSRSIQQSPIRSSTFMSGLLRDHQQQQQLENGAGGGAGSGQENISRQLDRFTSGALAQANSLIKGFGFGNMFQ